MNPDDPRHGTHRQRWRTVPRCQCATCEQARRQNRLAYKNRDLGRMRRIPTGPVVQHITQLLGKGWTQQAIAEVSGVSPATVSEAVRGVAKNIDVDNAAAILGVQGDRQPDTIPAIGVIRRIRALNALGWMTEEVCAEAGLCARFAADLFTKRRPNVLRASAEAIEAVYARRCMEIPEMTPGRRRTRTLAQQRGYPPPLAWDSIDDPHERPSGQRTRHADRDYDSSELVDEATVNRLVNGERIRANRPERFEAMRQWLAAGRSEKSLCELQGWKTGRYTQRQEPAA